MSTPGTRAEHHADSDPGTVRESRRHITRALEAGHQGRGNTIPASELAEFVPPAETTVRDIIAELRDDPEGPPIGNCADGYYVIADAGELEAYIAGVRDEIATKKERLGANVESFKRRHKK